MYVPNDSEAMEYLYYMGLDVAVQGITDKEVVMALAALISSGAVSINPDSEAWVTIREIIGDNWEAFQKWKADNEEAISQL